MTTAAEPVAALDPARPLVSVVVACTRPERIPQIAEALCARSDGSGRPDGTCELVVAGDVAPLSQRDWPLPTTLVEVADLHPNRRRSLGLAATSAPIVAFLDDDAVPEPGWLAVAASMPLDSTEVWTGPEQPTRPSGGARLAAEVAASALAEGTRAHVHRVDQTVQWFEAPFCNFVVTRSFLEQVGLPSAEIAWDIDDFTWCRDAARQGAVFRNRADLQIVHDRYPDAFAGWLRRKAAERRRTGQKVAHYPGLYLRIPPIAVAATAPFAGLAAIGMARGRRRRLLLAILVPYAAMLGAESRRAGRRGTAVLRFASGLVGLHIVSVGALAAGVVGGLGERVLRRGDPVAPALAGVER